MVGATPRTAFAAVNGSKPNAEIHRLDHTCRRFNNIRIPFLFFVINNYFTLNFIILAAFFQFPHQIHDIAFYPKYHHLSFGKP